MSPALKAMVEAMVAEIESNTDALWIDAEGMITLKGKPLFDLERVARAGLAAISIETLARALCRLLGTDPDKMVYASPGGVVVGWPGPEDRQVPLWTLEAKSLSEVVVDEILKGPPQS